MAKRYGDWEFLEKVGEGGQAETFRVRRKDGKEGILKRIKNPKRTVRFERELAALRDLNSMFVPAYLDAGKTDGRVWVVTEDCGTPLPNSVQGADVLRRLRWFQNVATAIRDAHALGIVHRDIKPDNVVVSRDGVKACLVDFGICAIADSAPLTSVEAFGNAAFAAPECGLGHPDSSSAASDIYSCGKLLYWLVSNKQFIFRESLEDLENSLKEVDPSLVARVCGLLRASVCASPVDRINAVELLRRSDALVQYAESLQSDAECGSFRIVDNLGREHAFDRTGSRPVISKNFRASDLHHNEFVVGGIRPNSSCAERFENPCNHAVRIFAISIAVRSLTPVSCAHVLLSADSEGSPASGALACLRLDVVHQTAEVRTITCDVAVPPGPFWVAFVADGDSPTYIAVSVALDDVAARQATVAKSFDGGMTWVPTSHTKGGGLAIRIDAYMPHAVHVTPAAQHRSRVEP